MQLLLAQRSMGLRLLLISSTFMAVTLNTAAADRLGPTEDFLRYPPRPLPAKACACRVDMQKRAVAAACPSPWDSIAGTSKVAPALRLSAQGDLVEALSGHIAKLHGINWFGWETASPSMDGLWAYNDAEVPPTSAVSSVSIAKLQTDFWGKRTMTNDFAHVVHRIKALGFNAVRLPMNFTNLQRDLPAPVHDATEFYACVRDPIEYINLNKTLDPSLMGSIPREQLAAAAPAYAGMPHPPVVRAEDAASCRTDWEAPWVQGYQPARQYGDKLQLTMCNWYLPQGAAVQAIHRFLWQVQYLVAQGFYVLIDHQSYHERDPNMQNPALFAANWGNLWRIITELPGYQENIKGRVFPDLVNEPSRWGCMWERECFDAQGQKACAVGRWLYYEAMRAIHLTDPDVPIFANAMGQSYVDPVKFPTCTKFFKGMNFGEGTITNRAVLDATGISDPTRFFQEMPTESRGKLALAPHVYPGTLTGLGADTQTREALFTRLDLSFGLKALGRDLTSDMQPLPKMAVVLGEFGTKDHGEPSSAAASVTDKSIPEAMDTLTRHAAGDFSQLDPVDVTFLRDLSDYLKGLETQGATVSWFWWAWNANSGDTKGLVGPATTWRDVQFTKIQLLSQLYGLKPWYCNVAPGSCACGGGGGSCGAAVAPGGGADHMRMPHAGSTAAGNMDINKLMALAGRRLKAAGTAAAATAAAAATVLQG